MRTSRFPRIPLFVRFLTQIVVGIGLYLAGGPFFPLVIAVGVISFAYFKRCGKAAAGVVATGILAVTVFEVMLISLPHILADENMMKDPMWFCLAALLGAWFGKWNYWHEGCDPHGAY